MGRVALAIAVLAELLGGCRAFDESLLDVDAGTSCARRVPPPRPMPGSPDDIGELVFVLRDVALESAGRSTGYDLDGLCTSEATPTVECVPPMPGSLAVDGPGGIDNVGAADLVPFIVVLLGEQEAPIRAHQAMGLGTTLVRVRGWNGLSDDDRVDVALAPAVVGGVEAPGGGPPELPADGTLPPAPAWAGSDWFWADATAFVAGDPERARIRDDAAYVSGGVLVARPPDRSRLVFAGADLHWEILLSDGRFTARIETTGLSSVVLAGRWPATEVLEACPGFGACVGSDAYSRIARFLEQSVDLRLVPGSGGPGLMCETVSLGIGATGYRASLAGLLPPRPLASPCP